MAAEDLLIKFMTGFEWDMENNPEKLDRADYEFYDEVKRYFEKYNTNK
jgi:hypothetical protein